MCPIRAAERSGGATARLRHTDRQVAAKVPSNTQRNAYCASGSKGRPDSARREPDDIDAAGPLRRRRSERARTCIVARGERRQRREASHRWTSQMGTMTLSTPRRNDLGISGA